MKTPLVGAFDAVDDETVEIKLAAADWKYVLTLSRHHKVDPRELIEWWVRNAIRGLRAAAKSRRRDGD